MVSLFSRYHDGKEIKADANVKISRDSKRQESYSMTLNLVKGKDTGEYEARVSNDQGTSSTKCHVQVNSKFFRHIYSKEFKTTNFLLGNAVDLRNILA